MLRLFILLLVILPVSIAAQTKKPVNKPVVEKIYKADHADLHEYVKIKKQGKNRIAYEIYMVNGGCSKLKHTGVAIFNSGSETDTDKQDNAFAVDEYTDKSKTCWVSIRIGAAKGYTNRARFIIADCEKLKPCKTESETLYTGE